METNQGPMTWATKGHVGVTARNNRRLVEAVLYVIAWQDLPQRLGQFESDSYEIEPWLNEVSGRGCPRL